jgi:hypothetical protein
MTDFTLQGSGLFATFDDDQLQKYVEQHIPKEKRMLWMGIMLGQNNLVNKINNKYTITEKKNEYNSIYVVCKKDEYDLATIDSFTITEFIKELNTSTNFFKPELDYIFYLDKDKAEKDWKAFEKKLEQQKK